MQDCKQRQTSLLRNCFLICLVWLGTTAAVVYFLLLWDIRAAELSFRKDAQRVFEQVSERVHTTETVLTGFSALLSVLDDVRYREARAYAQRILKNYPYINMIGAQVRVDQAQLAELESSMRQSGFSTFKVRDIDQMGGSVKRVSSTRRFYFPTTFMEPYTPAAASMLGLDAYSVDHLRRAVDKSIATGRLAASTPYELVEGGTAYTLFNPVYATDAKHEQVDTLASIVVRGQLLLPEVLPLAEEAFISLSYQAGLHAPPSMVLAKAGQPLEESATFLPLLSFDKSIESSGQPFQLHVERRTEWHDVRIDLYVLIVLFSCAGLWFAVHAVRMRGFSEQARESAYIALDEEKDLLEKRVRERTLKLSNLNQDLEQEITERRNVQGALQLKNEENERLSRQLINLQEAEYRRLSRELHDEIGQSLTVIKIDAAMIKNNKEGDAHKFEDAINSIIHTSDHVYAVVRDMMHRLRPPSLDQLGLEEAIRECVAASRLQDRGIKTSAEFLGAFDAVSDDVAIAAYRIVQEALTNIMKYSAANNVGIALRRVEQASSEDCCHCPCLMVIVRDDGQGMTVGSYSQGLGLIGLRERVEGLNGKMWIHSRPGEGVELKACLPIS